MEPGPQPSCLHHRLGWTHIGIPKKCTPTSWRETDFLDAGTGVRTTVVAGDMVIVPARTLHAEGAVKDKVVYILALPEALDSESFLKMREPNDLQS